MAFILKLGVSLIGLVLMFALSIVIGWLVTAMISGFVPNIDFNIFTWFFGILIFVLYLRGIWKQQQELVQLARDVERANRDRELHNP